MINDIKPGQISGVFLIEECKVLRTQDKRPYTLLELKDKSGKIKAFVWDKELPFLRPGMFIKASGTAKDHKDGIVLKFDETAITPIKAPQNLDDYIYSLDSITINRLWEELLGVINSVRGDKFYRSTLDKLLELHESLGDFSLRNCPLSDDKYGTYAGAFLEHIIYCCRHAKMIQQNYFDRNTPIDPDLLNTLVILQGVGRLQAYKNIFSVEKTTLGKLLPINVISANLLQKLITVQDAKKTLVLQQGIIGPPRFIESMLSQKIQEMDLLVGVYSRTINYARADQEFINIEHLNIDLWNK